MPTNKRKLAADALTKAWEAKLREALREPPKPRAKPPLAKSGQIDWFGDAGGRS